jgi:hypothetical protein
MTRHRSHLASTVYLTPSQAESMQWPSPNRMIPAIVLLHTRPLKEIIECQLRRTTTQTSKKSTSTT